MYSIRLKTPLHWNRQILLKVDHVFCFYRKRNICAPARALQEAKFRLIREQVIWTAPYWKWWQILLTYMWQLTSFYSDSCFSSFFVCELRVMVMKYILLLCYFFIDCCKLVFTCFFLFHDISVSNKVLFIKKYIYIEKLSNVIQM